MRWVTAKPPNMLMAVSAMRDHRQPRGSASFGRSAPAAVRRRRDLHQRADGDDQLIALVTLISGVCSAGVTFHTTM